MRLASEERRRREEHAGCAEAALPGAGAIERVEERVEVRRAGQGLHRADRVARARRRERQAPEDRLAVEEDRARPALALDGEPVNSCLIPVCSAAGRKVETVESLGAPEKLSRLQASFLECGGAQCGICTPGMILATVSLLDRHPKPSMDQIREGLAGNLCRCTGYMRIFEAVRSAAKIANEGPKHE